MTAHQEGGSTPVSDCGVVDWSKPLELMDGTPVRLATEAETKGYFGGTNPDWDGDYWVRDPAGTEWCAHPDGSDGFGPVVRNALRTTPSEGASK